MTKNKQLHQNVHHCYFNLMSKDTKAK